MRIPSDPGLVALIVVCVSIAALPGCRTETKTNEDVVRAVQRGDVSSLRQLIAKGADVSAVSTHDRTPLSQAIQSGKIEILEVLLSNGADPNRQNEGGFTALHEAVWYQNVEAVKLLLKNGSDVSLKDMYGRTPLHQALEGGDMNRAKAIAASVQTLDVFALAGLGEDEKLRELLDSQEEFLHAKGPVGRTALHYAALNGQVATVWLLIQKGAEVNARDAGERSPLFLTINRPAVMKALLKSGADVNATDKSGRSAVWEAVRFRDLTAVDVLVRHGADVNRRNEYGESLLHIPCRSIQRSGTRDVMDRLVSLGVDVNARNKKGETPLHWAAFMRNVAAAKTLVASGADAMIEDDRGGTALDVAAKRAEGGIRGEPDREKSRHLLELLRSSVNKPDHPTLRVTPNAGEKKAAKARPGAPMGTPASGR